MYRNMWVQVCRHGPPRLRHGYMSEPFPYSVLPVAASGAAALHACRALHRSTPSKKSVTPTLFSWSGAVERRSAVVRPQCKAREAMRAAAFDST